MHEDNRVIMITVIIIVIILFSTLIVKSTDAANPYYMMIRFLTGLYIDWFGFDTCLFLSIFVLACFLM